MSHQEWGKRIADAIRQSWPTTAAALEAGVATDCNSLMTKLISAPDSTDAHQLNAIFATIESTLIWSTAEIDKLKDDAHQLSIQNRELSSAVAALANRPLTAAARRKTTDPEKFTGDDKDIPTRQEKYLNFRAAMNRVLVMDSAVFGTNYEAIQYIASRLDGTCASQYRTSFETITENPTDSDSWTWKTPNQVWQALNSHYIVVDLGKEAKQELNLLKMKNKPYPSFLAEFQVKANVAGLTPEEKVARLRAKVSDELASAVRSQADVPGMNDFDGWVKLYQIHWDRMRDEDWVQKERTMAADAERYRQGLKKDAKPPANLNQNQYQQHYQQRDPTGDSMDLSAIPKPRMPVSREQCIAQGLCFYCKKAGHSIGDCQEKKEADARNSSRQHIPFANRGRGSFPSFPDRGFTRAQQQNNWPMHAFPQSQDPLNRLRAMEGGFIDGEVSSTTDSDNSITPSESATPSGSQLSFGQGKG